MEEPGRLLTENQVAEIREGVRSPVRGSVALTWVEQLLRDRDERVRREREIGEAATPIVHRALRDASAARC